MWNFQQATIFVFCVAFFLSAIHRKQQAWTMEEAVLSKRGAAGAASQDIAWRFAVGQTYDAETNPSGMISFATAENKLVSQELTAFTNKVKFQDDHFHYSFSRAGGARFPAALAIHLNEYLRPYEPITADLIKVTASATPLHMMLAWAVADPGDGILTSRPVYGRLELDFGNLAQVAVVYADTDAESCFEERAVDEFEAALARSKSQGVNVKAVFIINPNNPLGKCYPKKTLRAIMEFCQKHRLHLISDEIYACSVFDSGEPDATPFTSVLSLNNENGSIIDTGLLHVIYGMSKDFGAPGFRIGALISRSRAVHHAIDSIMRFGNPSGPSLAIAAAMLEDREWCRAFIDTSRERLAQAYRHVTKGLRDIGIKYLPGTNAAFFVWVDLSSYLPSDLGGEEYAEFALVKKLMAKGVFLHPREEHLLAPGWFRLVYSQDAATVSEGLRRIKAAIA